MMKLPILILGCALTATAADVAQVAGVSVPDSATVAGTKLMLNGAGLRKKAFFKVYVGALYLPSKAASAEAALGKSGPNRVAMHFLRDVDRESLVGAWSEGFAANNTPAEIAKLQARIDEFNALFSNVKEGQTIELDYLPDTGTEVRIAGQRKGTVVGEDFNRAMLRIWLGPSRQPRTSRTECSVGSVRRVPSALQITMTL